MSHDFRVFIRPDTPNPVRLVIEPPVGGEQNLNRNATPNLQEADIEELRVRRAQAMTIGKVRTEVTDWFLGPDLRPILHAALGQKIRIVIVPDYKLEPLFANVPFELTQLDNDPLVLANNLTSLVYAPRTSGEPLLLPTQGATFRILVVRAEPNHLAGTVPSGLEFLQVLRDAMPLDMPVPIETRLLSKEPGADGQPTWDAFREEVRERPPAAVVYLGHGELLPVGAGAPPSPILQIERPDGEQYELPATSLRELFRAQPVPLVVLAGCLTGAAAGGPQEAPERSRFGQSMAQFLVSGEGGVTVAIGMRYKLDTEEAKHFLKEFFGALVGGDERGHVDLAVKAARSTLFQKAPADLGYAAPVVYRRLTKEPLFGRLQAASIAAPAPTPGVAAAPVEVEPAAEPEDEAAQSQLSLLWGELAKLPASGSSALVDLVSRFAQEIDRQMRARRVARGHIGVLPRFDANPFALATAPGTHQLTVELTDDVIAREIDFDLVLRGSATWGRTKLAPGAIAQGLQRLVDEDDPQRLAIQVRCTAATVKVGAGALLTADIEVSASAPAVIEVSLTKSRCNPARELRGWVSAIIVRPT